MIIYATQYTHSNHKAVTASVDSGFQSLQEVIEAFGAENCDHSHKRMVLHGDDEDRVVFSDFPFRIDADGTMG